MGLPDVAGLCNADKGGWDLTYLFGSQQHEVGSFVAELFFSREKIKIKKVIGRHSYILNVLCDPAADPCMR